MDSLSPNSENLPSLPRVGRNRILAKKQVFLRYEVEYIA